MCREGWREDGGSPSDTLRPQAGEFLGGDPRQSAACSREGALPCEGMLQARGHPRLTHRTARGCARDGSSDSHREMGKGRLSRSPGRQDGAPGHRNITPLTQPHRCLLPTPEAGAAPRCRRRHGACAGRCLAAFARPGAAAILELGSRGEEPAGGRGARRFCLPRPAPSRLRSPLSRAACPCQPPLLFVTRLAGPAAGLREAGRMPCTPRR